MKRRRKDLLALAFLGCVCGLFFKDVFLKPSELLVSPYSDVVGQFGYWEGFLRQSLLRDGRIPAYNPHTLCGHPVAGNVQYLEYYPFRLASYLFSPDWASGFNFFLHAWLLCAGGYVLARQTGLSPAASLLSAMVGGLNLRYLAFVYAGFSMLLPSVSFIPWVWSGFWRMLSGNWRQGAVVSGVSLALCFLGGWPQIVLLNGLCLGLLLLCSFLWRPSRSGMRVLVGYALAAAGLAMGLSAFKLLPSLALSSLTTRSHGLSLAMGCKYSLPVQQLIGLLVPDFYGSPVLESYRGSPNFWEMGCSFTAAGLILAVLGLAHAPSRERFLLGVLALFCLLFSLGESSPLFLLCWRVVPGLSYFRGPARILFFFGQALAVLAGFGAEWLAEKSLPKGRRLWAAAGLLFLLIPMLILGFRLRGAPVSAEGPTIETTSRRQLHVGEALRDSGQACIKACPWIGGAILLVAVAGKLRRRRTAFWILGAGLVLGESFLRSLPFLDTMPKRAVYPASPVGEYLSQREGLFRVVDLTGSTEALPDGLSWRYRLEKVGGYDPSALSRAVRAVSLLKGKPMPQEPTWNLKAYQVKNRTVLDLLNVRYVVSSDPPPLDGLSLQARFSEVPTFVQFVGSELLPRVFVYENEQCLPRAWWVGQGGWVKEEEAWSLLEDEALSPRERVLLHQDSGEEVPVLSLEDVSSREKASNNSGEVSLTGFGPGRLELSLSSQGPGWVVASEMGLPGWHAVLDGADTPVLNANGWMLAVACPAGKHQLILSYCAPGCRMGAAWTAVTVLILAAAVFFRRKGRLSWKR